MVVAYDGQMGAVDRNNQMVASYKLNINTLKWWKKTHFSPYKSCSSERVG